MSTRAVITVKSADGKDVRRLYAHGDGYPYYLGTRVSNFVDLAPRLDGNSPSRKVQTSVYGGSRYGRLSGLGRAYAGMYNVSVEPDKFVPALITYLTTKGYSGLYLTDRDPEKESQEGDGTDIEWHYVITLGSDFGKKAKLESYYYNSSKHRFVKKAGSMKSIVAAEKRADEIARQKYKAEQEAKTKITVGPRRTVQRKTGKSGLGTIR